MLCSRLSVDCLDFGLIIDGATLSAVLKSNPERVGYNYREIFLEVCRNCSAVLCCCQRCGGADDECERRDIFQF